MSKLIIPKFNFTSGIPEEDADFSKFGQHTTITNPNNSLAPNKFNEYERVMVELCKAIGDYDMSDIFPNVEMNLSSVIRSIYSVVTTRMGEVDLRVDSLDQSIGSLASTEKVDINRLYSSIGTETSERKQEDSNLLTRIQTLSDTVTFNKTSIEASLASHANQNISDINSIKSTKYDKTGGAISGDVSVSGSFTMSGTGKEINSGVNAIRSSFVPSDTNDIANLGFNDARYARKDQQNSMANNTIFESGITMKDSNSNIEMSGAKILDLYDPTIDSANDLPASPVPRSYIDRKYAQLLKTNEFAENITFDKDVIIKGKLIGGLPIGTVMMFDGNNWSDNNTMPGWYACIADNVSKGCSDLTNKFIYGSTVTDRGNTGGFSSVTLVLNNIPQHTHDISHNHGTHSHTIDDHVHTVGIPSETFNIDAKTSNVNSESSTVSINANPHPSQYITPTLNLGNLEGLYTVIPDEDGLDIGISSVVRGDRNYEFKNEFKVNQCTIPSMSNDVTLLNGTHIHTILSSSIANALQVTVSIETFNTGEKGLTTKDASLGNANNFTSGAAGASNPTSFSIIPPYYKMIFIRRCE